MHPTATFPVPACGLVLAPAAGAQKAAYPSKPQELADCIMGQIANFGRVAQATGMRLD